MFTLRIFPTGVATVLLLAGVGTAAPDKRVISLRAVLHDPTRPVTELYTAQAADSAAPLKLRRKALSPAQPATVSGGSILLYSSPDIDPDQPARNLVGKAKVPANATRAILLIVPGPDGATGSSQFRAMVINDTPEAFPYGSAQLVNGTSTEVAVLAGEHRIGAKPGKVIKIPPVNKVNDFNLAQTNFYYRPGGGKTWEPFVERQLKYLKAQRRIFIVHVTPGATTPAVATILDTVPTKIPDKNAPR